MDTFIIDNTNDLSLDQLRTIFFNKVNFKLSENAILAIQESANFIAEIIKTDAVIYGVNTGFLSGLSIGAIVLYQKWLEKTDQKVFEHSYYQRLKTPSVCHYRYSTFAHPEDTKVDVYFSR